MIAIMTLTICCSQGEPIEDPFRRGLGYAAKWYDCLRERAEELVDGAISNCVTRIKADQHKHNELASQITTIMTGIQMTTEVSHILLTIDSC